MDLHHRLQQIQTLDDDALLHSLKRFVASSNHLTAVVLAHLAEVDARRAYRRWACDTLLTYCIYELRLSEDEAQRRCRAARVARPFPILFEMLADASIHLTGIVMLAPYLTEDNHRQILARARYRRKTEIQKLVAELAPTCDVPAVIEPLAAIRPAARTSPRIASMEAVMGGVRRLVPGDGPAHAPSASQEWRNELLQQIDDEATLPERDATVQSETALAQSQVVEPLAAPEPSAPARSATDATRYKVQFTADQEYIDLVEQARALSWHTLPHGDLAELHRLAMQMLVDKLLRRKAAVSRPEPAQTHGADALARNEPSSHTSAESRRHLPASLRRFVWERDVGRCTFTDDRGVRCPATSAIEFHHEQPYARGGPHSAENVALRCRAHNDLAAEADFGGDFMQSRRGDALALHQT
jgi:hypothetical protein